MGYRVFRRAWWADRECNVPVSRLSRGTTIRVVETEQDARAMCREFNVGPDGERVRRPYGVAYEYERV